MPDRETLYCRTQEMRSFATPAEAAVWKLVRGRKLGGLKFRRQQRFPDYIADFACFSPRLIVEADDAAHQDPDYDARRDAWFAAEGFTVLRFSNEVCIAEPGKVAEAILKAAGR